MFETASWIWYAATDEPDDYAEFFTNVSYGGGKAELCLSVDSDYTLWINDEYVASGQYGDFEHYKIYDVLDVTDFLREGDNRFRFLVHHCGVPTSRYRPAQAGLLFDLRIDGKAVAVSDERVLSRRCTAYACGQKRFVSSQLGFTFSYDATREGEGDLTLAVLVQKDCRLFPRPIPKSRVLPLYTGTVRVGEKAPGTHFLIDLGRETVGFPTLSFSSETEQTLTVAWGEHLADGGVRRVIGNRNFFFTYRARAGENRFANYMLRLGCRYLEVFAEEPILVHGIGIRPQVFEIAERRCQIDGDLDRRIYEICIRTLRLCMMEHYVDTPWREQALYAYDSRNQMLFGYDAFENGNAAYARANLKLIGEDRREDGLLSICYPAGTPRAIPSFSLYYVIAMWEYAAHTGDLSLFAEYAEKLQTILQTFLETSEGGLIRCISREGIWNFYDWSPYLSGAINREEAIPDLIINCLYLLALDAFRSLCARVGRDCPYPTALSARLRTEVRATFMTPNGALTHRCGREEYTELGNALAILADVVTGEEARTLCDRLASGELSQTSLSMAIWKYEALLKIDENKYRETILDEIRRTYGAMLEAGSTTVWETEKGESDFHGAGSLCHGWSAIPVAIFHRFGIAVPEEK